ncbi:sigma-54-dependent Fis family transcriptional regulator [Inhella crocodyli]|uniref:Sigma-54-dependent Fis family transcriptional regulator n=1 Tax=Inhella crocodyli TaxID=2499851 RepID=A0A437LEH6_9BURK|nr:sigma-54-dependent Fis family transcriptional regulator [Inhella crocodyli]RVT83689.1 sigma-54-dependent Fis family transcriptional regulator [Inhella crocodyli]
MAPRSLTLRNPTDRVRAARRQWLETGELSDALLSPQLRQSWARSHQFGLAPQGRSSGAPHASAAQLARALEHRRALVSHAQPVMAFLHEQIRDSDSLVILADPQGMLLHAMGDDGFADRAARVALRPGAIWSEQWRGTNAIGTALAEGSAVVVHGGEHYLARNGFLTCAAAPIADPNGQLLGVIDISGDRRGYHRHTLGLVRSGARMVEHQLFLARHGQGLHLRLHVQPEGLGTVTEGLLALSEDGWVVGANSAALEGLGLARAAIGTLGVERLLGLDLATLRRARHTPQALRRADGSVLWLRLDGERAPPAHAVRAAPVPSPAPAMDALSALDTGDAALHAALARARRVMDRPIPLLLQGESGVGKELMARAVHACSARRAQPFVAVNCAALPEGLIEAELFGYRPGAFTGACREGAPGRLREAHGGTLFLDEIGDMPLPLQARLLRVLQDRQVVPLGGGKPVDVDFALVGATHRRLADEVAAGRFREDLYYRLNGLTLTLPPLRERSDLPALVAQMLAELAPGRALALSPALAQAFARYRWPGNLRQLANVLRTAVALSDPDDTQLERQHLSDDLLEALALDDAPARAGGEPGSDLRTHTAQVIDEVLASSGGNLSEAARRLGVSRNTLYRRLARKG